MKETAVICNKVSGKSCGQGITPVRRRFLLRNPTAPPLVPLSAALKLRVLSPNPQPLCHRTQTLNPCWMHSVPARVIIEGGIRLPQSRILRTQHRRKGRGLDGVSSRHPSPTTCKSESQTSTKQRVPAGPPEPRQFL